MAEKETSLAMEVSCPQFLTGFKCAPAREGDCLRANVVGDMACDILLGDSSPLYLRLYDEGLINTSFGGATLTFGSFSLSSMAFAAISGIILHFVLPGRKNAVAEKVEA